MAFVGSSPLSLAFLACFFAIGIPFWQIPYNRFDLTHIEVLPGAVLLGVLTMLLVKKQYVRAGRAFWIMSLCVPAVDVVTIIRDTRFDPTTHNLAPFELIIMWLSGAVVVFIGYALGRAALALSGPATRS
ncbi:MAG: hypothetical protein JSS20_17650 [Proteobacteria bacterium]|nr:hypothetical protein [Pseudomonadota bacterium]